MERHLRRDCEVRRLELIKAPLAREMTRARIDQAVDLEHQGMHRLCTGDAQASVFYLAAEHGRANANRIDPEKPRIVIGEGSPHARRDDWRLEGGGHYQGEIQCNLKLYRL